MWRALGATNKGCLFLVTGKTADAVQTITSGIAAWRLTGASVWMPLFLLNLAEAQAKLAKFEDAWRSMAQAVSAMEATKEVWCEAEELVIKHIDHILKHVGEDGVGFGSDFDGAKIPTGIGNAAGLQNLVEVMRTRDYGEPLIEKLCYRNWLRVLGQAWGG